MRAIWFLLFILACFGVTGRIDYDAEMATSRFQSEYAKNFAHRQEGQRRPPTRFGHHCKE